MTRKIRRDLEGISSSSLHLLFYNLGTQFVTNRNDNNNNNISTAQSCQGEFPDFLRISRVSFSVLSPHNPTRGRDEDNEDPRRKLVPPPQTLSITFSYYDLLSSHAEIKILLISRRFTTRLKGTLKDLGDSPLWAIVFSRLHSFRTIGEPLPTLRCY